MPLKKEGFQSVGEFLSFSLSTDDQATPDQIKTALFFVRQIVSVLLGLTAGFLHLQGILTILGFLFLSMGFSYYYVFKYKQIDEDRIENTEIYTEGLGASIGEFLLTWTLIHTVA
ncbi:unnamed protein product [Paramecium octaurelia]|uniref:Rab5-interacting protein n=1 Tax=Paramecium octaurelia TaxID=43137 RepID=A0A8S1UGW0_PAROT|nr:unnamed protein product [Paramecium octaurelia]